MRIALGVFAAALTVFAQAKLPPYSRDTLPNGAVILMLPRAGVPLVHFRVLIKGGVESEPGDKAGLADVTASLLERGTAKRTAAQFAEELDYLGGTFNAVFDAQLGSATAISAEFLKKDFDQGLDLLTDATLHPAFTETEVKKELARKIDSAKAMKDSPQASINAYFRTSFFGGVHPYGHPADAATLAHIARADIAAYHSALYCGKNMVVVVTGDFDPASAKGKLAHAFGAAPAGAAYAWKTVPALARKGKLLLIDKPDATQTYFQIAQPGIDKKILTRRSWRS